MLSKKQEIILRLFKDREESYNSRSISKKVGLSHVGAYKILRKMEKEGILTSKQIGKAVIYSIENNIQAVKEVELALILETQKYNRWVEEFKELEKLSLFSVLFGSIIRNEKEARDIDLLVVADGNLNEIKKIVNDKNKILPKKIHLILQSKKDFENDLRNRSKVIIEIIKTGIVLSGFDDFAKELR